MERFDAMLRGGHPNSLGRTVEVVEAVLADRTRLHELIDAYGSEDPVVRLRVSNAVKRVESERPDWITSAMDRLITEVGPLDQPSAQWTLAQLFQRQAADLTQDQRKAAVALLKRNLQHHHDWIVLNTTIETLSEWATHDDKLKTWLGPHLERLARDPRKSVAGRAKKVQARLFKV